MNIPRHLSPLPLALVPVAGVMLSGPTVELAKRPAKDRPVSRSEAGVAGAVARTSGGTLALGTAAPSGTAKAKIAHSSGGRSAAANATPPPGPSSTPLIPPSLNSPANQATNVGTSPTLSVTATDPNASGGNVTVTFYGRQHVSSPMLGPNFVIIPVSDTQYYVSSLQGGTPATLDTQMQWIVNNNESLNIAYVAGLGDVVQDGNNNGNPSEWLNANHSFSLLEDPVATGRPEGIPYGLSVGNHDQGPTGNGGVDSSTTSYNQYFGISRFSGRSYYGGSFSSSDNNNHYD